MKAVRTYHKRDAEAARASLRTSLDDPYWRTPAGAGKATAARSLLETYFVMDARDGRPAALFDLKSEVQVGADVVAVNLDVCVFDDFGYGSRTVLWDKRPITTAQAQALAAPCVSAIEQEMGLGTAESADIWHMRTQTVFRFTRASARRGIRFAETALRRAQA
jgi:hypothetical protein